MKTTIEFEDETIDVEVEYNYYPGEPMVWTYSNGDPGHPGCGPEIEVISITDGNGKEYVDLISDDEMNNLYDEIEKQEPDEPDFDI